MRRVAVGLVVLAGVAVLAIWGFGRWTARAGELSAELTARVMRATLPITITAGGELESAKTVTVVCEVEGQEAKIVEMMPQGAQVRSGDEVMRFDTGAIERALAAQQIKVMQTEAAAKAAQELLKIETNKADSEVAKAKLALTLAKLDKKKYAEGDYGVEVDNLKGSIALAEADLNEAKDTAEYYAKLVKKGFRTPEQLRAKEQAMKRAEYNLSRDREKLRVLEEFTRERQLVELTAKAEEAERELVRAESSREAAISKAKSDFDTTQVTTGLEKSVLERLQKQLDHCVVKAPQDGVVVYNKDKRSTPIELGAMVHYKQKLFTLPDLTQMQVKAYVHESVIKKVKSGLKAEIRIDAFSNVVLEGAVVDVATFYDSSRQYTSGGVKEYATKVKIAGMPDVGLKPGMTAEVKILAGELSDALLVPLQAVAEQSGQYFCYVFGAAGAERREVSVGDNNESFIEIKAGLSAGEQVALNARARAASDATNHKNENGNGSPDTRPSSPADSVAVSQAGL